MNTAKICSSYGQNGNNKIEFIILKEYSLLNSAYTFKSILLNNFHNHNIICLMYINIL